MSRATVTAGAIRVALRRRYCGRQPGPQAEAFICLEEARAGAGFDGNAGQCDVLAINTWKSRGMQLIGHEIKTTRADWQRELADPAKAERFARYCHLWWIVAPAQLATAVRHEIPTAWGLLAVSTNGTCTELVTPARRQPDPVPEWWWIGWMAQLDRERKRRIAAEVDARITAERARLVEQLEQQRRRATSDDAERLAHLHRLLDQLCEETGIDIRRRVWSDDIKALGRLWQLRNSVPAGLAVQLRDVAGALDELNHTQVVS